MKNNKSNVWSIKRIVLFLVIGLLALSAVTSFSVSYGQENDGDSQPGDVGTAGFHIFIPVVSSLDTGLSNSVWIDAPNGGSVSTPDEMVTVVFAPHGLPGSMRVSIQQDAAAQLPANFNLIGSNVSIQAVWDDGSEDVDQLDPEAQPYLAAGNLKPAPIQSRYWASIRMAFPTTKVDYSQISIARLSSVGKWEILATEIDVEKGFATAETDRLGIFALITNTAFSPARQVRSATSGEIVVDDLDSGFQHFQNGNGVFDPTNCGSNGCWAGHAYWTYNRSPFNPGDLNDPVDWVHWTPSLPAPGFYAVDAFIPAANATTVGAVYKIFHSGGMDAAVVNQLAISADWAPLGVFEFAANGSEYVRLEDVVPEKGNGQAQIGFDAVRFTPCPDPSTCGGTGDTQPPVITNTSSWVEGVLKDKVVRVLIRADVTDNVGVDQVKVVVDGTEYAMSLWQGDTYSAVVSLGQGKHKFYVEASDAAGNIARDPSAGLYEIEVTADGQFGERLSMGYTKDPINTGIGNYFYKFTDVQAQSVGPDIIVERWYNAQSLYEGSFGVGWTFTYDLHLTEVDNMLFSGVQVRYPDGHTVNFEGDGGGGYSAPDGSMNYDVPAKDGAGYKLTTKDQSVYRFDNEGRLISLADADGNAVTLSYSGDQLTQIVDASGRAVTIAYAGDYISSINVPGYGNFQYGYQDDHLISVIDTEGSQVGYEYNGDGYLTKIVTPNSNTFVTEQQYDDKGRVTYQKDGNLFENTLVYDDANRTVSITDAEGNTIVHVYDDKQRVIEERDELGNAVRYTYNDDNEKLTVTDKNGNTTTFTYDDRGNPLTITDALGNVTSLTYDSRNNVLSRTDALGNLFTYEYDSENHLTRIVDPLGGVTVQTYNSQGLLVQTVDALGNSTAMSYNSLGLPVSNTDALGNVSTMTYDSAGRLTSLTDAEGNTATYVYNSLGLLTAVTDPGGFVTTYEYDADHNLSKETNADGYSKTYVYDENARLVAETDWAGNVTTYVHDHMGRKVSETDALGTTVTNAYDPVGNLISKTDKRGATTTYTYDAAGNLLTKTDALGNVTSYTYDVLNRQVEVSSPCACASRIEKTIYDALGRRIETIDALGNRTQYEYDALGRQIRVIDALGNSTQSAYDLMSNLVAITDASGNSTTYEYNALYQQTKVVNRLGDAVTRTYDKSGRMVATTDERGNITQSVFDGNNRLLQEIDALGNVTSHTYDGRGNRLTTTDALGRVKTSVYDANGNQVSTTNARGFTTKYTYDVLNRRIKTEDALGLFTNYTFDASGSLLSETDALGYTKQTTYDILGRRQTTIDRNGNVTSYAYDPAGNLVLITDALGGTTTHVFDANNNKTSETNALGYTTVYGYDALNRQISVLDALNGTSTTTYDALGRVIAKTDANGNSTTYGYNAEGRRISTTDAAGNTSYAHHDAIGNLVQEIDRNGNVSSYAYDALNRQVSRTNALGYVSTTQYDAVGNVVEETNFRGYATQYEYDENNNRILTVDALDGTTSHVYDGLDRLISVTDANGKTTTSAYDAVGNLTSVTLPEGQKTTFTYDGERNRLTATNALGHTTTYTFDALNRQVSEIDPIGNTTVTVYDAIGQVVREVDANGHAAAYTYDALGRLIKVTDAAGFATAYIYDSVGNRVGELDANGHASTYVYNELNRLVSETNGNGSIWSYTYDPEGNLIQRFDANGQTTTYEFDAEHQMTAIRYPDSSQDVTFVYDANGNMVEMVDAVGTTSLLYDELDRETSKTDAYGRTQLSTFDAVGNRLSLTYPDGNQVLYVYNGNNWLVRMVDPRSGATSYGYQADGQVIRTDYPNGTWTANVYDDAGRLISVFNGTTYHAGVITSYQYTLDGVGNRVRIVEKYTQGQIRTNTKQYTYDVRNELLKAVEAYQGPPAYVVTTSYAYDSVGNRVRMETNRAVAPGNQKPQTKITLYSYDSANQLLRAGDVTYTYNANGNRVSKLTPGKPASQTRRETYAYDAENRLVLYTRIRVQSNQVEQRVYNVYDGLGRRVNKGTQESSGTIKWTEYALDGLSYDQIAEFPQTGQPRKTELYRGLYNQLVSMDEIQGGGSGSQYWFANDGLGSVSATTKQNGQSAHEYFYDPYGQIIDENGHWEDSSSWTNPHNHYLLTGKEWDEESRLYYFGARFYDGDAGVWLTPDPYRSSLKLPSSLHSYLLMGENAPGSSDNVNSPMSLHRYLYVQNNPLNRVDPLGFFDQKNGYGIVEPGDTIWGISQKTGVSVNEMVSMNPQMWNFLLIYPGQKINLSPVVFNAASSLGFATMNVGPQNSPFAYTISNSSPSASTNQGGRERERDRRWRERNFRRLSNLSIFDERGKELLGHWLAGSGETLNREDGNWGDYMKANRLLPSQLAEELEQDAYKRYASGPVDIQFHADIENGYTTGYEMLHGTNLTVGDFQIKGHASVSGGSQGKQTVSYDLRYSWNDIIDPNPQYFGDVVFNWVLDGLYDPEDYTVHIHWNTDSWIEKTNGRIEKWDGYPFQGSPPVSGGGGGGGGGGSW